MMIDRELLRKAYPNGLLAMRGVRTVRGWTCLFVAPNSCGGDNQVVGFCHTGEECRLTCWPDGRVLPCSSERHGQSVHLSFLEKMLHEGDLLPDVDPEDVATWACCLADLATACLVDKDPPTNVHPHRHWVRGWHPAMVPLIPTPRPEVGADWTGGWVLDIAWGTTGIVTTSFPFTLNADDPAIALVLARVQLREKEGR